MGRFTRPDEVADLIVLLASDRAGNVTGTASSSTADLSPYKPNSDTEGASTCEEYGPMSGAGRALSAEGSTGAPGG